MEAYERDEPFAPLDVAEVHLAAVGGEMAWEHSCAPDSGPVPSASGPRVLDLGTGSVAAVAYVGEPRDAADASQLLTGGEPLDRPIEKGVNEGLGKPSAGFGAHTFQEADSSMGESGPQSPAISAASTSSQQQAQGPLPVTPGKRSRSQVPSLGGEDVPPRTPRHLAGDAEEEGVGGKVVVVAVPGGREVVGARGSSAGGHGGVGSGTQALVRAGGAEDLQLAAAQNFARLQAPEEQQLEAARSNVLVARAENAALVRVPGPEQQQLEACQSVVPLEQVQEQRLVPGPGAEQQQQLEACQAMVQLEANEGEEAEEEQPAFGQLAGPEQGMLPALPAPEDVAEVQQQVAAIQAALLEILAEKRELCEAHAAALAALQEQLADREAAAVEHAEQYDTLQQQHAALQEQYGEIQQLQEELQEQYGALKQRYGEVQQQYEQAVQQHEEDLGGLEDQLAAAKAALAEVSWRVWLAMLQGCMRTKLDQLLVKCLHVSDLQHAHLTSCNRPRAKYGHLSAGHLCSAQVKCCIIACLHHCCCILRLRKAMHRRWKLCAARTPPCPTSWQHAAHSWCS